MARSEAAGWALGVLALAITSAAAFGFGARHVELNLGPGDTPFVSGFQEEIDVDNKVGWHWTTYDAGIALPFEAAGVSLATTLRYARMFGEEAVVNVRVGQVAAEAFRARGGETRTTTLSSPGVSGPLTVALKVDSHERRNMGLRLDRITVEVESGEPLRLQAVAALRPVVTALLLLGGLLVLGVSPLVAGASTLVMAAAFAIRASADLFGAWRQTTLLPEMLVLGTAVLFVFRKAMERWTGSSGHEARWLAAAALFTMAFRLALICHPDFYYPDLMTHARVVETIANQGPSFFLHPADALNAQGAWTKPVLGSVSSLPYAVLFHTPFAVLASTLGLSIDQIETALKAGGSLISVLPIMLAGLLAGRLGLPPMAALALCVIPTYTSRLSFALLPALSGHVFDLVVLLALLIATGKEPPTSTRPWLWVAATLLAGHLAYTSSVVNEGLLMGILVVLCLGAGRSGVLVGGRLVLAEAVAALLAFALYYRHFVGDVFGLAARLMGKSGGAGAAPSGAGPNISVYPIESFWALLFERTHTFFGWSWMTLAVAGLILGGTMARNSRLVQAWGLTYLGLILLRAKIPDVFRYGHETLFLTPFVAILAGSALVVAFRRGGRVRILALLSGGGLVVVSFREQWLAVADQLSNAL
ncbi:MAG: hypothetical protein KA385_08350 [Vicinamibacteria bacterium]|nr:hypothetical protein [Vicinamibacteria bacterium]